MRKTGKTIAAGVFTLAAALVASMGLTGIAQAATTDFSQHIVNGSRIDPAVYWKYLPLTPQPPFEQWDGWDLGYAPGDPTPPTVCPVGSAPTSGACIQNLTSPYTYRTVREYKVVYADQVPKSSPSWWYCKDGSTGIWCTNNTYRFTTPAGYGENNWDPHYSEANQRESTPENTRMRRYWKDNQVLNDPPNTGDYWVGGAFTTGPRAPRWIAARRVNPVPVDTVAYTCPEGFTLNANNTCTVTDYAQYTPSVQTLPTTKVPCPIENVVSRFGGFGVKIFSCSATFMPFTQVGPAFVKAGLVKSASDVQAFTGQAVPYEVQGAFGQMDPRALKTLPGWDLVGYRATVNNPPDNRVWTDTGTDWQTVKTAAPILVENYVDAWRSFKNTNTAIKYLDAKAIYDAALAKEAKLTLASSRTKVAETKTPAKDYLDSINAPVSITAVSPRTIPAAGGTVTVDGTGFVPGTTVKVNGVDVTPTIISRNQLTFTAPQAPTPQRILAEEPDALGSDAPATLSIAIENPHGFNGDAPNAVTYEAAPAPAPEPTATPTVEPTPTPTTTPTVEPTPSPSPTTDSTMKPDLGPICEANPVDYVNIQDEKLRDFLNSQAGSASTGFDFSSIPVIGPLLVKFGMVEPQNAEADPSLFIVEGPTDGDSLSTGQADGLSTDPADTPLTVDCGPTPTPTATPTTEPTSTPAVEPTPNPTATSEPTATPTVAPTPSPTAEPTTTPTPGPTGKPDAADNTVVDPTPTPTPSPTDGSVKPDGESTKPTVAPTPSPTNGTDSAPTSKPVAPNHANQGGQSNGNEAAATAPQDNNQSQQASGKDQLGGESLGQAVWTLRGKKLKVMALPSPETRMMKPTISIVVPVATYTAYMSTGRETPAMKEAVNAAKKVAKLSGVRFTPGFVKADKWTQDIRILMSGID